MWEEGDTNMKRRKRKGIGVTEILKTHPSVTTQPGQGTADGGGLKNYPSSLSMLKDKQTDKTLSISRLRHERLSIHRQTINFTYFSCGDISAAEQESETG